MPPQMTREQLALQLKQRYPQYQALDDNELVDRVLQKHPVYQQQLEQPTAQPLPGPGPQPTLEAGRSPALPGAPTPAVTPPDAPRSYMQVIQERQGRTAPDTAIAPGSMVAPAAPGAPSEPSLPSTEADGDDYNPLVDFSVGLGNTALSTGYHITDLLRRATGGETMLDDPKIKALITGPQTGAGKVGTFVGEMAQLMVPVAGWAGKGAKAATMMSRLGMGAQRMGGLTTKAAAVGKDAKMLKSLNDAKTGRILNLLKPSAKEMVDFGGRTFLMTGGDTGDTLNAMFWGGISPAVATGFKKIGNVMRHRLPERLYTQALGQTVKESQKAVKRYQDAFVAKHPHLKEAMMSGKIAPEVAAKLPEVDRAALEMIVRLRDPSTIQRAIQDGLWGRHESMLGTAIQHSDRLNAELIGILQKAPKIKLNSAEIKELHAGVETALKQTGISDVFETLATTTGPVLDKLFNATRRGAYTAKDLEALRQIVKKGGPGLPGMASKKIINPDSAVVKLWATPKELESLTEAVTLLAKPAEFNRLRQTIAENMVSRMATGKAPPGLKAGERMVNLQPGLVRKGQFQIPQIETRFLKSEIKMDASDVIQLRRTLDNVRHSSGFQQAAYLGNIPKGSEAEFRGLSDHLRKKLAKNPNTADNLRDQSHWLSVRDHIIPKMHEVQGRRLVGFSDYLLGGGGTISGYGVGGFGTMGAIRGFQMPMFLTGVGQFMNKLPKKIGMDRLGLSAEAMRRPAVSNIVRPDRGADDPAAGASWFQQQGAGGAPGDASTTGGWFQQ